MLTVNELRFWARLNKGSLLAISYPRTLQTGIKRHRRGYKTPVQWCLLPNQGFRGWRVRNITTERACEARNRRATPCLRKCWKFQLHVELSEWQQILRIRDCSVSLLQIKKKLEFHWMSWKVHCHCHTWDLHRFQEKFSGSRAISRSLWFHVKNPICEEFTVCYVTRIIPRKLNLANT